MLAAMNIRPARGAEAGALEPLIRESARVLNAPYFTPEETRSVLQHAIGFDPRLVEDGTYYVAEEDGTIIGGGGWSRRNSLAGYAPLGSGDDEVALDPGHDAAPVRAFFVRPAWARRGIGRRLLAECESAARAAGFGALELLATPAGERLYRACGFDLVERIEVRHPDGLVFHPARMRKRIRPMSRFNPPFRSSIYYSAQNEDYRTELAVLERIRTGAPQRVLMIASSGENALSLLTQEGIEGVVAVDINPAQVQLCELRRTAAETLTRDEQLQLLGADPAAAGAQGAAARLALYDRLRPQLPEATRAFWDERREREIAFGVHHVGRNDVCMHDIQDRLAAAGFTPFGRPLRNEDLPAWQDVYTKLMTSAYIQDLFGLPSEALAARISGIAGRLGECHFKALRAADAANNPFVTTAFANAYAAGEEGLPLYLQQGGQAALRRLGTRSRLHLAAGNLVEQMPALAETHGRFDLISISNIADWMDDAQFGALAQRARSCLRPGGALLARTATGSPMIVEVTRRHLEFDAAFNARLPEVERGPWFRTLAAGYAPR